MNFQKYCLVIITVTAQVWALPFINKNPSLTRTNSSKVYQMFQMEHPEMTKEEEKRSISFSSERNAEQDPSILPQALPFPMNMLVGQDQIKHALYLAASNPRMGGVLISGKHGTGKSVMARAMQNLLPPTIEVVKGSSYNIDPEGKEGVDSLLREEMNSSGLQLEDMETENIKTPFVQIPLNVMDDCLVGSIDLETSISAGYSVFSPGLLARAHRGILYIDDINLLDEEIIGLLFEVISEGFVIVEREGLSIKYPCKPMVIATYNPQEGEVRKHLTDRIAVSLSADTNPLSFVDRVRAVDHVIAFSNDRKVQSDVEQDEIKIREKISLARNHLKDVKIANAQILYLCEEATRAGCEGQRAEIFATEVAKTNAAFNGRNEVNGNDLKVAVFLAIAPRSKYFNSEVEDNQTPPLESSKDENSSSNEQLIPPPPAVDDNVEENKDNSEEGEMDQEENRDKEKEDTILDIPDEFLFGVDMIPLDPELLMFGEWTKKGKGGKSSRLYNLERGRYVKPIFPKGKTGRLAVGATLRAAAPLQLIRRQLAKGTNKEGRLVYIDKSDFRIKRMARKAGALIIFVVDSSGSMALNRMDAAKGAAIGLLAEAYKNRNKICLINFHGKGAEVLVPPTKSIAMTKSRLQSMPCGGGSPLAHAIEIALRTGVNSMKIKKDVGRCILVLITDGRANIPLCISHGDEFDPATYPSFQGMPTKQFLHDEVISCAKRLGAIKSFNILIIDTEDKFVSTGLAKDIAIASMASYYRIDARDSSSIESVTKRIA